MSSQRIQGGKMNKMPEYKPQPTMKFLVMPIFCALVLAGVTVYGSILANGNDLVATYKFTHNINPFMVALFFLVFLSIIFTVGWVGPGNKQNLLVFANLAVMFGLFGIGIFGISTWDKKPKAALATINNNLRPVVEQFFAQESVKPLESTQVPHTPYTVVEAVLTLDPQGNYRFTKPEVTDPPAEVYRNSYKQNLHLLEIFAAGGTPDNYRSIVVVVRTWVDTHRKINLDLGSVPELRQLVNMYIVDTGSWTVIGYPDPILGGRAHRPIGGPGAGTIYISEVRGKEVEYKTIQKTLDKLTWE
jgi:hypothetical protein